MWTYRCMLCFFFFQAEDGIRDLTVTGVQTCALPISVGIDRRVVAATIQRRRRSSTGREQDAKPPPGHHPQHHHPRLLAAASRRSEERRVGKEGRSRWAPAE